MSLRWVARSPALFLIPLLLLLFGCGPTGKSREELPPVGLFTSLPLIWPESADLSSLLRSDALPHWVVSDLGKYGTLTPLDSLAGADGALPLPSRTLLVMAQPRPLSPDENVALDQWVRDGGRLLLFADPLLTSESVFPVGDARRPQDVVLLSPILAHWGLELQFDEWQVPGRRLVVFEDGHIPVDLAGQFGLLGREEATCMTMAQDLVADCVIGEGRVLAVADAALLDRSENQESAPDREALRLLLDRLAHPR